jgi:hypothetical protein
LFSFRRAGGAPERKQWEGAGSGVGLTQGGLRCAQLPWAELCLRFQRGRESLLASAMWKEEDNQGELPHPADPASPLCLHFKAQRPGAADAER